MCPPTVFTWQVEALLAGLQDNLMVDEDGDGIWSITVSLAEGTSGNYAFLNGNCGDWSCKEDLMLVIIDPKNHNDFHSCPVTTLKVEHLLVNALLTAPGEYLRQHGSDLPSGHVSV